MTTSTEIVEQLISTLTEEINEREGLIRSLRQLGGPNGNGHRTTKAAPSRSRKWTPERRKKFMATVRKRRRAEAKV